MLPELGKYIEEMGGPEEWRKKCLAEEKRLLLKLDLDMDNLPFNNPATVNTETMSKSDILKLWMDENFKYQQFFMGTSVQSFLEFNIKLMTFIQLHLLDDVKSETEPTQDIIFRVLKKYVEMNGKE